MAKRIACHRQHSARCFLDKKQLEKELSALDPGTTSLVFDFANLEYISSAGLRLVIAAYKKMAGKEGFRIVNVSDEVYDVFSLTGFDQKINIEKK